MTLCRTTLIPEVTLSTGWLIYLIVKSGQCYLIIVLSLGTYEITSQESASIDNVDSNPLSQMVSALVLVYLLVLSTFEVIGALHGHLIPFIFLKGYLG